METCLADTAEPRIQILSRQQHGGLEGLPFDRRAGSAGRGRQRRTAASAKSGGRDLPDVVDRELDPHVVPAVASAGIADGIGNCQPATAVWREEMRHGVGRKRTHASDATPRCCACGS